MPAIPPVLGALVMTNVDKEMRALNDKAALASKNPAFFIAMMQAIGAGIALGSPVIAFTTTDSGLAGAPPIPGVGSGVGIVVDADYFEKTAYETIRGYVIADFGKTTHAAYPPPDDNSGAYLRAVCKGVAQAVKTHYATAWILTSAHPIVYLGTGTIGKGKFTGLQAPLVKSQIMSLAPQLTGKFWPRFAQGIAEAYVKTILTQSTGTVSILGICVPSPAQICGLPIPGAGTGVAA